MFQIKSKKTSRSKRHEKIDAQFMNIDDVVDYLSDNKISITEKPYIFTHLNTSDGRIIIQEVCGLICSPVKLAEKLNIK